jgi:cyclase
MSAMPSVVGPRFALVVGFCLALSFAYIHGQERGLRSSKFETVKVKDDLFVLNNPGAPGNTTVLVTDDGVLLVDDKFPVDYQNIVDAVTTITNQPIKYLINTHYHIDHTGGNAQMQSAGVVLLSSENTRENMVEAGFKGPPSITFERRANVALGSKRAELYYFGRGHTNGDIVVLFPEQRTLVTGDLYVTGNTTPELIDYPMGGSAKEWTQTLDGVLGLDFDVAVPGHGVVAAKADVRKFRDSTVVLRNRVADLVKNKASRDEIEKVMRGEFHWGDLHVNRGLDGIIAEMRFVP